MLSALLPARPLPQDAFRALLPSPDAATSPGAALACNAAAGAAAGALSLALVYPFEFATVRLAADLGSDAARQYGSGASVSLVRSDEARAHVQAARRRRPVLPATGHRPAPRASGMTSAWLSAMRAGGGGPLALYQGFGVAVLSMAAYKVGGAGRGADACSDARHAQHATRQHHGQPRR